ncbi:glyoxylate/hydroxypyruvate reductase A [Marinomonas sp. C2222]|uniref:Glyoxylate/hydroxypyruvate reductase A n=1 Tax=Marinomonas sargassi TaxID=2984494 RepID=A0ABT2YUI4_9GAMM|nr:glyoxylate/hydroxypyruvate reductase A [Marinomonas sargassi]MCV2403540.1 glyoxylate/hydroxypyruvate reductase A [Marinomonas sargassi]
MNSIILLASNEISFNQELIEYAKKHRPDTEWVLPDDERASLAKVAACWFPDKEILKSFPNLQLLHSLAAGVEHLDEKLLTAGLPICRIVDKHQQQGMFEYVLWGVLHAHRDFDRAIENQKNCLFERYAQCPAKHIHISVLGLGVLGKHVAQSLASFGYTVSGWSKSPKSLDKVNCFSGEDSLDSLLEKTDILVNLLPLSSATYHILSKPLFDTLPKGSYVINCGRGGHVKDEDLINAVTSGHLRGALLDVFEEEPLPASHPFWHTERVVITPHMASAASISVIVDQVSDNTHSLLMNQALQNTIDTTKGY